MKTNNLLLIEENDQFCEFVSNGMKKLYGFNTHRWIPNQSVELDDLSKNSYAFVIVSYRLLIGDNRDEIISKLARLKKRKVFLSVSPVFNLDQAINSVKNLRINFAFFRPVKELNFTDDLLRKFYEALHGAGVVSPAPKQEEKHIPNSIYTRRSFSPSLIAIGSSTGGPQALISFLSEIPAELLSVPVFVTQHMPEKFTEILAKQIEKATKIPTFEGRDGIKAEKGHIYIAPGGKHMLVKRRSGGLFLELSDGPQENFCKPSVDPMLRSIDDLSSSALVVILTGMGRDGFEAVKSIKNNKMGYVMAQDEESSVVWGMPGAICKANLQDAIGTPSELGKLTLSMLRA